MSSNTVRAIAKCVITRIHVNRMARLEGNIGECWRGKGNRHGKCRVLAHGTSFHVTNVFKCFAERTRSVEQEVHRTIVMLLCRAMACCRTSLPVERSYPLVKYLLCTLRTIIFLHSLHGDRHTHLSLVLSMVTSLQFSYA
jgi:hypothetical protein